MGGRENKLRDKYRDIIKDWTRYAYIKWWDPSGCRHISLSLSFLVCVCVCVARRGCSCIECTNVAEQFLPF